jgi:hypothetical protein
VLVAGTSEKSPVVEALARRSRATERRFAQLARHFRPSTVFMQLEAGDCALAMLAAGYVERVYAVDPHEALLRRPRLPSNLRLIFSGNRGFGLDTGTVHVAFSEVMAADRLEAVRRSLAPGGVYFYAAGPRPAQARRRLVAAGFSRVRFPSFLGLFDRGPFVAAHG